MFEDSVLIDFFTRIVPEAHTASEVAFLERVLGVSPPARLLDAPCGSGRHSLALAARGFDVTGVDLADGPLRVARDEAARLGLAPTLLRDDICRLTSAAGFDGACCLGMSFGYFDDAGNEAFLRGIAAVLKPGAGLLLDAAVAETVLARFAEREWYPAGEEQLLVRRSYDPSEARLFEEFTIVQPGRRTRHMADYRIYLYRDLVSLLRRVGFGEVVAYGGTDGRPFGLASPSCLVVARKA